MRQFFHLAVRASLVLMAAFAITSVASRSVGAQSCAAGTFNEFEAGPCVQDDAHVSSSGAMLFEIDNEGFSEDYYYITPNCSGIVINCSAPSYYVVDPGSAQDAEMDYSVSQSYGSGTAMAAVNQGSDWAEVDIMQTVYGQAAVVIDSAQTIVYGADQRVGLCAVNCFTATATISTVPFYTMGMARDVTLVYNEERAHPRPFIYATVSPAADAPAIAGYELSVTLDGGAWSFTNGETTLHFASPGNVPVRLGGQFALSGVAVHTVQVNVLVKFANGTSTPLSYTALIATDDESGSPVARGWTIAGVGQLMCWWAQACMVREGDGSIELFPGASPYSTGVATTGPDRSVLSYDTPSGTFVRRYTDGSYVQYSGWGSEVVAVDQFGRETSFAYDGNHRLIQVLDQRRLSGAGVPYLQLTYDANGLRTITEQGGPAAARTTTIWVDNNRNLWAVTDPDGVPSYIDYDGSNRLSAFADRRSANTYRTYYGYDAYNKLASVQAPSVPIDQGNGVTAAQSPATTYSSWQGIGVPIAPTSSSPPMAATVSSVQAVITAPGSRTTRLTVNNYGQLATITDPTWATTTISYAGHDPVAVQHPDLRVDSLGYDGLDRVIMSRPADQSPTHYYYNAVSQIDSVRGASVVAANNTYNADHTLHSTGDASGVTVTYAYNANKQPVSATDNAGHQTTYGYDGTFANQDTVTLPGSRMSTTTYDGYGRPSVVQAPGAAAVTMTYDVMNRPTTVAQAGRPATQFGYDNLLRLDVTDANNNTTHTDYNALGWPVARRDPNGVVDSMYYDAAGRVTTWKNRRGDRMRYTYDVLDHMTSRTGRNVADNFSYYIGQSVTVAVAWNAIERDSMFLDSRLGGQPSVDSTVIHVNGARYRVLHGETPTYPMTDSTTISATSGVSFRARRTVYGSSGLPTGITDGFSGTTPFFTNEGLLNDLWSPVFGNRIISYTNTHQPYVLTFDQSALLPSFRRYYHYDSTDRLDQLILPDAGNTQLYAYPAYGELGSVTTKSGCGLVANDSTAGAIESCPTMNGTVSFTYDNVGNRTDLGATYYAGNRLALFNGGWNTYDADGNLHQKYLIPPNPHNEIFSWNPENRLDTVSTDGYYTVVYKYNALGRPVLKYRQGVLDRVWVWDGDQLLLETDGSNQRVGEYQYAGTDAPYAVVTGSTNPTGIQYQEQDALGNVLGAHTGTTPTETISYDPWGYPTYSGDLTNRLMWKGLIWEGDMVGLYYMRARWYDPAVGRFIQEDPLGVDGGINVYAFAGDDPVNGSDPSGADPCTPTQLMAGWTNVQGTFGPTCLAPTSLSPVNITAKSPAPPQPNPPPVDWSWTWVTGTTNGSSSSSSNAGSSIYTSGPPDPGIVAENKCGVSAGTFAASTTLDAFGAAGFVKGAVGLFEAGSAFVNSHIPSLAAETGPRFLRLLQQFGLERAKDMRVSAPIVAAGQANHGEFHLWEYAPVPFVGSVNGGVQAYKDCWHPNGY